MGNVTKLKPAERKIIDLLEKPSSKYLTVNKFCKKAGISRQAYYTALQSKSFQAVAKQSVLGQVPANMPGVMESCIKYALEGSHIHQKLLMIIAGVYNPKLQLDVSGSIEHSVSFDFMKIFKGLQAMRDDPKLRQNKTIELSEDEFKNLPDGDQGELGALIFEDNEPEEVPVEVGTKQ